jgi:hypothetical protein
MHSRCGWDKCARTIVGMCAFNMAVRDLVLWKALGQGAATYVWIYVVLANKAVRTLRAPIGTNLTWSCICRSHTACTCQVTPVWTALIHTPGLDGAQPTQPGYSSASRRLV